MKKGNIVVDNTKFKWVQFIRVVNESQSIMDDGYEEYILENEYVSQLELPIGLVALGFNTISANKEWPKIYRNSVGFEIEEREPQQFFINTEKIRFTDQVQNIFSLYDLLPIDNFKRFINSYGNVTHNDSSFCDDV